MNRGMSLLMLAIAAFVGPIQCDTVPVLLWSNHAHSPNIDAQSGTRVDQIESADLLASYTENPSTVVAFLQKDLSVEQFAANNAPFVSKLFDMPQANPVCLLVAEYTHMFYAFLAILGLFRQRKCS